MSRHLTRMACNDGWWGGRVAVALMQNQTCDESLQPKWVLVVYTEHIAGLGLSA